MSDYGDRPNPNQISTGKPTPKTAQPKEKVLEDAPEDHEFKPCRGECGNTDLDQRGICHRTHLR